MFRFFFLLSLLHLVSANHYECSAIRDTHECTENKHHCIIGVISDNDGRHLTFWRNLYLIGSVSDEKLAKYTDCLSIKSICDTLESVWINHNDTNSNSVVHYPCNLYTPIWKNMYSSLSIDTSITVRMCYDLRNDWNQRWANCEHHISSQNESDPVPLPVSITELDDSDNGMSGLNKAVYAILFVLGIVSVMCVCYKCYKNKKKSRYHVPVENSEEETSIQV